MVHERNIVYKRPTRYVMGTDAVSGNFLARSGGYTNATGGAVFRGGCVGGCAKRRRKGRRGRGFIAIGRGLLPV